MNLEKIFPMQQSEFIKSVNFGSYLKKKCIQKLKTFIFTYKLIFIMKIIFLICNKVYSDRSEIDLSHPTIRIQNFWFSRKLWWKNLWNYYVAEKRIVSKLSKISNLNSYNTNRRLEWSLCQNFSYLSFIVSEKWDAKERDGRTGSGYSLIFFTLVKRILMLNRNIARMFSVYILIKQWRNG